MSFLIYRLVSTKQTADHMISIVSPFYSTCYWTATHCIGLHDKMKLFICLKMNLTAHTDVDPADQGLSFKAVLRHSVETLDLLKTEHYQ